MSARTSSSVNTSGDSSFPRVGCGARSTSSPTMPSTSLSFAAVAGGATSTRSSSNAWSVAEMLPWSSRYGSLHVNPCGDRSPYAAWSRPNVAFVDTEKRRAPSRTRRVPFLMSSGRSLGAPSEVALFTRTHLQTSAATYLCPMQVCLRSLALPAELLRDGVEDVAAPVLRDPVPQEDLLAVVEGVENQVLNLSGHA